jgi:hypothetical protein
MRLHLATQRFLAERRGDRIWEASCDYAALSLERIGARLRPGMFEQPLFAKMARAGAKNQGRRARRGYLAGLPRVPRQKTAGKTQATTTTAAARGGR